MPRPPKGFSLEEGELLDSTEPFPTEEPTPSEEAVEIQTIEAAGIIKDSEGNEWVIPAENVDDLGDLSSTNPFKVCKYDPRFTYITEREDRVTQRMTEGFRPVTRREVGLPPLFQIDGAKPQTDIVHIMDTVMMKIPNVIAERRRKAKLALINEQLQAMEPTDEMLSRAKQRASSPVRGRAFSRLKGEGTPIETEHVRTVGPEPRSV